MRTIMAFQGGADAWDDTELIKAYDAALEGYKTLGLVRPVPLQVQRTRVQATRMHVCNLCETAGGLQHTANVHKR